jgi:predicted short-subunit dehydrogenase-like oxidoreductase (DUF2520 family)
VFVLGAGHAGRGLARALRAAGASIVGLHGRAAERGLEPITAGALPQALRDAQIVLVAVRDAQLPEALRQLMAGPIADDAVILHASGSAPDSVFDGVRSSGHAAGTFHPLLPLAEPARAGTLLRGAWIGVAGDEKAVAEARTLAGMLGANTLDIPADRAAYHAAAVIASNLPTVLAASAVALLTAQGVPERTARAAVASLLAASAINLGEATPEAALTGPVVRGDVETIRRHLASLETVEREVLDTYRSLTRLAVVLARRRGEGNRRQLDEIEALLD